jgi:mannose-6-phosphate isomerase-like protein (cupin superfamily)
MTTHPTAAPVTVTLPGQARIIRAFGDEAIVLLDSEQTGGSCTLWVNVTPPGGGPPPHYHLNEDEWFVVQEGRAQFFADGQTLEVGPGGAVFAPRGSTHTFKNIGDQPLRMLVTAAPAGFEKFFARCAEEFTRPGGPDMERIVQISAEHGIHYVQP